MRIDEKALVPVGWVLSGFGIVITVAVMGTFWVSSVNSRLQRIEEKLGIPPYHSAATPITVPLAEAGERHDDPK